MLATRILVLKIQCENLVKNFRKYIKENYPDIGLQIQEAYLDIPDIFYQFFGLKVVLTEELKNELLKLLKDDISLYRQLLIELGRLRADGKLYINFIIRNFENM